MMNTDRAYIGYDRQSPRAEAQAMAALQQGGIATIYSVPRLARAIQGDAAVAIVLPDDTASPRDPANITIGVDGGGSVTLPRYALQKLIGQLPEQPSVFDRIGDAIAKAGASA